MQPTKILSIAAYRNKPWPPTMRRAMALHLANTGFGRKRRVSRRAAVAVVGVASLALWALLAWALSPAIEAALR